MYWSFACLRLLDTCGAKKIQRSPTRAVICFTNPRLDSLATEFLREMCKLGQFFMCFSSISIYQPLMCVGKLE